MADTYSREGAERLARTIERKWRQRGEAVKTWVEPHQLGETTVYFVRSNLINGLPPRSELAKAA